MTSRATTPKRRGRPAREDVRAEVLAAAEELLRTMGLEAITVADLLESSGVSRATFYKHFSDRDDVIAELYVDHVNTARMEVVKALSGSATVLELLARAPAADLLGMRSRGPLTVEFAKLRYSNDKMIAARDGVSPKTVRNQLSGVFAKLGVASQTELLDAYDAPRRAATARSRE